MKILTTLFLLIVSNSIFAQVVFTVDNFSKDYYGKVAIEDTSEVFSKGWVAIFDTKTNKQLVKVTSDELALELHEGKVVANIKELHYGEQSLIMYDDYNFDGRRDLAIEDGQNSCYHGPSYKVYLATKKGFAYSKDFTKLAQDYCGMFDIDSSNKIISTMTKSGCCWHQYSEFVVENNKPKAIKIVEDDQTDFPYGIHSEEIWNGKKMVKTAHRTIDLEQEGIKIVLSFTAEQNDKQVVLFNINDRTLNYALVQKDGTVEFSYPIETVYQNPDFKFDTAQTTRYVSFVNKNARYRIYEDKDGKVGIEIGVGNKDYMWLGLDGSKQGSLDELLRVKLDNVVIR